MKTISSARTKLALVAFASLWLSACGGGGGDVSSAAAPLATTASNEAGTLPAGFASGVAAPAPSAGAAPSPASAPSASFREFDRVRVASSVAATAPATARLPNGGNVVVWTTDGGRAVWAQTTTAAGELVGSPIAINDRNSESVPGIAVAATGDGGFAVAYVVSDSAPTTQFSAVRGIQVRRFSAAGARVSDTRVNDQTPNYGTDGHLYSVNDGPVIKALPDGGFVVGWTGEVALPAPSWGFLQRLAADGSRAGPMVVIGGGSAEVTQLTPNVSPDGTVVAVWQQQDFAATGSTYSVYSQHFGTDAATLSQPTLLVGTTRASRFAVGAAALSNGSVAVAWAADDGGVTARIHGTLLAADGTSAAPVTTADVPRPQPAVTSVNRVAIVPLGAGFGVLWQLYTSNYRAGHAELFVQRHDAGGAATEAPSALVDRSIWWVSAVTGAHGAVSEGFTADGGADGHFTTVYARVDGEQGNAYLLGR